MNYTVGDFIANGINLENISLFGDLYDEYCNYCDNHSYPKCSKKMFSLELNNYGMEVYAGAKNIRKVRIKSKYMRPDNVNQPNHYQIGNTGLECKDFISAWVGKGNYGVFCFCNIMKYLVRAEKKNKLEDYKKALKYLDMIIEAGADTIVLDIADVGIEVGTKEYAGVDWNAIIAEITKGLSARQALLLDSVFRSLADEDYVNCKDKLINFIKDYEVE
ncbi:Protein of unknwon function (DUF3310) [Fusobacterium polymorphum]|nr:DUF3310 domain-containing protein [Fusobacterium polymorphum]WRL69359.1 DUF3310 domain-containing protein [Fusobacterium polymorphum]CKH08965.1 Protein of unknwon function (DUF3310) [Fusobacterium polymorphum]